MHRELEWPVSKATCLYAHLYMVYRHLYKIIEGTRTVVRKPVVCFNIHAVLALTFGKIPLGSDVTESTKYPPPGGGARRSSINVFVLMRYQKAFPSKSD